jgi:hypothetical protein
MTNSSYVEVVLEGSIELIKGFVIGFLEGRGIQGKAVFEEDDSAGEEGALAQLLRLVSLKEDRIRVVVRKEIHDLLEDALQRRKRDVPARIVSVRDVRQVSFDFRYHTYSRQAGEELKEFFRHLPEGLQLEGYQPREVLNPDAKGVEAYAPEHDYEVEAEGKIRGEPVKAVELYDRLKHVELIELGEIRTA